MKESDMSIKFVLLTTAIHELIIACMAIRKNDPFTSTLFGNDMDSSVEECFTKWGRQDSLPQAMRQMRSALAVIEFMLEEQKGGDDERGNKD